MTYGDIVQAVAEIPLAKEADTIIALEYPVELGYFPYVMADGSLIGLRNRRYGRTVLACTFAVHLDDLKVQYLALRSLLNSNYYYTSRYVDIFSDIYSHEIGKIWICVHVLYYTIL